MACARCGQTRRVPAATMNYTPVPRATATARSTYYPSNTSWSGDRETDLMFEIANIRCNGASARQCCLPSRELYMASRPSACCYIPPDMTAEIAAKLAMQQQLNYRQKQCCQLKTQLPMPMSFDYFNAKRQFGF